MSSVNPIFLRNGSKYQRLLPKDILLLKAEDNYVRVYLSSGETQLLYTSLKRLEATLVGMSFLRVHRSFIINVYALTAWEVEKSELHLGEHLVPLSRAKRKNLEEMIRLLG
ncbi:MAG: LytR/AlgR family response regulator transcription factor [Lewinella sp.]|uniref:LytR/AlgR family response regulator transcription factor n=1 Tax=Lewinella sp. TaxID=2004506 RepID=UPI003D6BC3CD